MFILFNKQFDSFCYFLAVPYFGTQQLVLKNILKNQKLSKFSEHLANICLYLI